MLSGCCGNRYVLSAGVVCLFVRSVDKASYLLFLPGHYQFESDSADGWGPVK